MYDEKLGIARYRGKDYRIIGLHGGNPLLENTSGEKLVLDAEDKSLSVVRNGKTVFSTPYNNSSGDWAAATFSVDGRFIVLGCPYDFDFMVFEREVAA